MSLAKFSSDQLITLGEKCIAKMYRQAEIECSGGEGISGLAYGLDWPTAAMLYPRQVGVFRRLRGEYLARKAQQP